jgi:hypothetical protein
VLAEFIFYHAIFPFPLRYPGRCFGQCCHSVYFLLSFPLSGVGRTRGHLGLGSGVKAGAGDNYNGGGKGAKINSGHCKASVFPGLLFGVFFFFFSCMSE